MGPNWAGFRGIGGEEQLLGRVVQHMAHYGLLTCGTRTSIGPSLVSTVCFS
jgi:hypothetical protein